jgi:hypothetical protein
MFCEGADGGAYLHHDDQYRGCSYGYVDRKAGAAFRYVSPDYFRLVPWEGEGLKPVGYGYDSIEALVQATMRVNAAGEGLSGEKALGRRREVLEEIDHRGILATPANSSINELVTEAARLSIAHGGKHATIDYAPIPSVRWRDG